MELPNEEGEMPIPLNSSYGHGHMIHHHHHDHHQNLIIPSSGGGGAAAPLPAEDDQVVIPFKKPIRYRECLKNHAAAMGGNATDGCGEFMPSGEEGTLEALTCSACSCHRNFHRKETDGDPAAACDTCYVNPRMGRKLFVGHHHHNAALGYHHHAAAAAGALISSRAVAPHPMIMSYMGGGGGGANSDDQSDEHDGGGGGGVMMGRPQHQMAKKRFRTKFTAEQKEKMLNFAEKVGWKIQKQEENVVQQFCQEIGVKRRVLKVWMHNNKHNLAKKNLQSDDAQTKFD